MCVHDEGVFVLTYMAVILDQFVVLDNFVCNEFLGITAIVPNLLESSNLIIGFISLSKKAVMKLLPNDTSSWKEWGNW